MKNKKDFLSVTDLTAPEIMQIFKLAKKLKDELKNKGHNQPVLANKQMVMLFEKPSLRTKLSFDIGFSQLGGHSVYFGSQEVGIGTRESVSDVAEVTSSMSDLIVARVYSHKALKEFALNSKVPVINALSDLEHPAQALADLFTIWEIKGRIDDLTIGYVGDCNNNVTHSLCLGAVLLGANFKCAAPKGYEMNPEISAIAKKNGSVFETADPKKAVENADVVYTDTWVSMGSEDEKNKRLEIFKPYQVTSELMSHALPDAIFMHDLPAYRGNEVTDDVIDGKQSVVFQQSENRMHVQKALMINLLNDKTQGGELYE